MGVASDDLLSLLGVAGDEVEVEVLRYASDETCLVVKGSSAFVPRTKLLSPVLLLDDGVPGS